MVQAQNDSLVLHHIPWMILFALFIPMNISQHAESLGKTKLLIKRLQPFSCN
jgi:hypothetical protein